MFRTAGIREIPTKTHSVLEVIGAIGEIIDMGMPTRSSQSGNSGTIAQFTHLDFGPEI